MQHSWESDYRERLCQPEEAVDRVIKSGDRIFLGGLKVPTEILQIITQRVLDGQYHHLGYYAQMVLDDMGLDNPALKEDMLRHYSIFYGARERQDRESHTTTITPVQFYNLQRYYEFISPDVGIFQVSPPDERGMCSLGPMACGFSSSAIPYVKNIILRVNRKLPRVYGINTDIPVSAAAAIVETDEDLPNTSTGLPSPTEEKIASYILERIDDGSCIQLGIGGIANAVGYGLASKKHLGAHSEMLAESIVHLMKLGVIDNSRKKLHPGRSLVGFTSGRPETFAFTHENKDLLFASYDYINNFNNVIQNDNFVSVNNTLSIDLSGQVSSESFGTRQYSGSGGQVDYVRAAQWSKNGKSFFVLTSTVNTKDGVVSRIVPTFPAGTTVTTLRSDVQYVVTEYGCVNLFGQDMPNRVRMLISIAHPDFRDQLTFEAKKLGLLY